MESRFCILPFREKFSFRKSGYSFGVPAALKTNTRSYVVLRCVSLLAFLTSPRYAWTPLSRTQREMTSVSRSASGWLVLTDQQACSTRKSADRVQPMSISAGRGTRGVVVWAAKQSLSSSMQAFNTRVSLAFFSFTDGGAA